MTTENSPQITYRDVFRNRNWIRLWIGQTLSQLGDAVAIVAFPLLVYDMTEGSVASLSASFAIQLLPLVTIGPMAGAFGDRWNRKTLLFTTDVVRAVCALGIFFSASLWQIYVLQLIAASMQACFLPTYSAIIPQLTGDQYSKSISLSYTGYQSMKVLGTVLAVVVPAGPRLAFLFDAATFTLAALMTRSIHVEPMVQTQIGNFLDDIGMAFNFFRHNTLVRYLTVYHICFSMGIEIALKLGLVTHIKAVAGGSSDQLYKWSVATSASAFACVTWLIGYLDHKLPKPPMLLGGPILAGLSCTLFFFQLGSDLPALYSSILFFSLVAGVGQACALIPVQVYLAEATPKDLHGRVFAFINAIEACALLAVFTLFAMISDRLEIPPWALMVISGTLLTIGIPLCTLTLNGLPAMRKHGTGPERKDQPVGQNHVSAIE